MEENNKSGFTAEGRKLRPRRPRISDKVYSSNEGHTERRSFSSEDRHSSSSEGRSYGRRSYGSQDSRGGYGNSDRRSAGRPGSYSRSNGSSEGRGYGYSNDRNNSYSDRRSSFGRGGDRRNYGSSEGRSYGSSEGRSYGQQEGRGSYGNSERRSYGSSEGRNFGPSGRRVSFNSDRPARRPYGSSEGRQGSEGRSFGQSRGRSFGSQDNRGGFRSRPSSPRGNNFNSNRKPQAKPNPYKFSDADEQNMNLILSRKPQLDQIQLSDNDYVETPIKEVIRLNKFIANSGICSRREADQYIQAGVVTVNGEVVTELGTKVNVLNDEIRFNGERIRGEEKCYIVMNKPKGFVTTASDPHAEKTVMDLLKKCSARVFPVGRLDKNTTGVLMFTNDGEIAERLTHPSYDKKKIYQVILDKPVSQEDFDKILEGITLSDGDIKADELEFIDPEDHRKVGIEIHSGKNRIVRRIFESLGYDVKALDRVYFAGLTKKGLKKGEWRYLTEGEANVLKMGSYV